MAEGIARSLGCIAESAGTHPAQSIASNAVVVLESRGISTEGMVPKNVDKFSAENYDLVISMGCGVHCPLMRIDHDWELKDPVGQALSVYQSTADTIEQNLKALLE